MGATRRIKTSELSSIKRELIKKQKGLCPICGKSLLGVVPRNVVVDHDHKTGIIRGALHRGCNGVEGKVMKFLNTWGKCKDLSGCVKTLERLIQYWKLHRLPQTNWIYPAYKTESEKKDLVNKRRRLKAKRAREAKK